MLNGTLSVIHNGCNAKLQCKDGDLANHVGCAFDMWEMRLRDPQRNNLGEQAKNELVRDVLTELHQLGFKW